MKDTKENLIVSPYFKAEEFAPAQKPVFDMKFIVEVGKVCRQFGYNEFNIEAQRDGVHVKGHGRFVKK